MKQIIKSLGKHANQIECDLYREVLALNNHMNNCSCDDAVYYDFCNTCSHYEVTSFCLNCGGYIDDREGSSK